ncbi:MAG: DMT family protein [Desulfuromonadaceae bacterium]|nr:DMT family protein [Desulfuromonadaceae bacterium]
MPFVGLKIPVVLQTVALLTLSNVFMTFAWYAPEFFQEG